MLNIFVDDLRKSPENYLLFRTAEDFIAFFTLNSSLKINILSLDHDLGLDIMDGYDLVKEIVQKFPDIHIKEVRFHTDNYIGFKNMYHYMSSAIDNQVLPNVGHVSPFVYDVIDGEIIRGYRFNF